ncbi:hypothetical protein EVAR_4349_1 [Eumeta japonica]|uniref:Uncharacterized protein n=1 Tax=Eumeta variegata TaxID=151549 RepID=A0A4C1VE19_EUMVA|nr:hypothetical protein EVAR_4349_1 [Eumeta japonica]
MKISGPPLWNSTVRAVLKSRDQRLNVRFRATYQAIPVFLISKAKLPSAAVLFRKTYACDCPILAIRTTFACSVSIALFNKPLRISSNIRFRLSVYKPRSVSSDVQSDTTLIRHD